MTGQPGPPIATPPSAGLSSAVVLAWIAGATDAIGFLTLGGVFVSFMSGDTTRLGVALAASDRPLAYATIALVTLFVVGVCVAALAGARAAQAGGVLLLQAMLLAGATWLIDAGRVGAGTAALVFAMAFANTAASERGLGVTAALVRIGQGLATAIAGGARLGWLPDLLLWVALVAGGTAGAALEARWGSAALWMPAAASFVLALSQRPKRRYGDPARGPGDRRRG